MCPRVNGNYELCRHVLLEIFSHAGVTGEQGCSHQDDIVFPRVNGNYELCGHFPSK